VFKINVVSNLAGSGWIAFLTLVATPVQIHLLGVEAYGLVGLIAILQIVFGTLDLGLSAAVTQSISSDTSVGRQASAPLINSAATVYWLMAFVIAALLWLVAGWIATRWLNPQALNMPTVLTAVHTIGLYVALRWPIAFYSGVLNGVQRMDVLNLVKAGAATLRIAVGILVIVITRNVTVFLGWFAISAALELVAFAIVTHKMVPALGFKPYFSLEAVRSVWRFSLTMAAIAILAVLITQLDRILVSKLLSLRDLGYYTLAYTTGIGISLLQVSINTASLPAFSEAAQAEPPAFVRRYQKVSEFTAYAVALPCFALVFFGADILRVWVNEDAARAAGVPLAVLAIGFFLNAAVSNAYIAAVATRNASIPAMVNVIGVLLYVPGLYWLTSREGTVGAAAGWVALNLYYVCSLLPLVHRRVLKAPVSTWLWRCLLLPALVAIVSFGTLRAAASLIANEAATWAALATALLAYGLLSLLLMSSSLRDELVAFGPFALVTSFARRALR
jgi:O-antigen/teichoic acid export membrane protein